MRRRRSAKENSQPKSPRSLNDSIKEKFRELIEARNVPHKRVFNKDHQQFNTGEDVLVSVSRPMPFPVQNMPGIVQSVDETGEFGWVRVVLRNGWQDSFANIEVRRAQ